MSTSTMHFGPEWMRKQPISRTPQEQQQLPPSSPAAPTSNASTYSALVSPAMPVQTENRDDSRPFRYSKEELLQIYRDGGGQSGLGLEVERWEGVVREVSAEPTSLREISEAEKKLFATSLNSDLRRRQSTDFLSPVATQNLGSERPRLNHNNSASPGSPLRERFGPLTRRRGESTDQIPSTLPRKLSLSSMQSPMSARDPGMPSPRNARMGSAFDGVFPAGADSWTSRRRASEGMPKTPNIIHRDTASELVEEKIKEEDETAVQPDILPIRNQAGGAIETAASRLSDSNHSSSPSPANSSSGFPPSGLQDLNSVEWSYLDPQGQVQGPFRADLMQKWQDEGYFTPDLLMKRTLLDTEWTTVAVLATRTTGPLFLTPHRPVPPPGLHRTVDPHSFPPSEQFSSPFQPSPIRSIRSSTFESFMGGSNPSDSPASSLGAGRYSNDSPDPNAFGGRAANYAPGPDFTGVNRRNFYDPSGPIGHPPTPARSVTLDNTYSSFAPSPWPPQANGIISPSFDPLLSGRGSADASQFTTRLPSSGLGSGGGTFNSLGPHDILPSGNAVQLEDIHAQQAPVTPGFSSYHALSSQQPTQSSYPQSTIQKAPEPAPLISPWGNVQELRQPGPFDSNYPTSANTVPSPIAPWGAPTVAPRPTVPKPATSSPWANVNTPTEENNYTSAEPVVNGRPNEPVTQHDPAPTPAQSAAQQSTDQSIAVTKKSSRAKAPSKPTLSVVSAEAVPASPASASPAAPTPSKPVWAKEDDSKPSGVSLSLRDIQEAEAKKKAAEKEKERPRASVTSSTSAEDVQSFSASWGLPTSQAGGRVTKEASATSSPAISHATPVWTTAVKAPTVKKTMKEIQEEEEARKKLAAKETVATIAARRGYAETMVKPGTPIQTGGAWTTVGPSGKTTPLSTAPSARPATIPAAVAPTLTSAPRVNGTPTPIRTTTTPVPPKPAPTVVKLEEYPAAPSHEFLKWLNESLQGLNKTVNVEEIMQMLLSFPVDPDTSTVELIAEMVYSNSTTLDGRHFAANFVSKRKADAAARPKSGPGANANKPISIAEVVKAQPKPPASEWGGFKVVNKKKKGGRA